MSQNLLKAKKTKIAPKKDAVVETDVVNGLPEQWDTPTTGFRLAIQPQEERFGQSVFERKGGLRCRTRP